VTDQRHAVLFTVEITRGYTVTLDYDDIEWVSSFRWYSLILKKGKSRIYAYRPTGDRNNRRFELMHRAIMMRHGWSGEGQVDHVDGNGLNNCKSNLRSCNSVENGRNRGPQTNNKSGYKGVSKHTQYERWVAQIKINGKQTYLGVFIDSRDAALVYDEAARQHFGEFAVLNFPNEVKL
jgi:hypothetical protein